MPPQRWQQIEALLQSALERKPDQRAAFLAEACADDASLRIEVESLIACEESAANFIEAPVFKAVAASGVEDQVTPVAGRRLGPYEIIREIGHGGMGVVWLAERADGQFSKQVAIKLVKRGMDTEEIVRRFRHERQILASLEHPHIARLLDGGTTDDGLPYFVMEYTEGRPIDKYCDHYQLNTVERLKLFRAVCSAVHHAHQRLVIHRDLKPSNILVTPEGVPKLLDFGIAKLLRPDLSLHMIGATMPGLRLMTPHYASPEQVRGEPITTASDVYSLGVLLYELLTGHCPYRLKGDLPHEIARAIGEEEPEKPSAAVGRVEKMATPQSVSKTREGQPEKLRRRLKGDLDNIVFMALRKEPQRRYTSVEQFSEDIRRHLAGLPVIARKDTLGYRTTKFIKRHKMGMAAAALIVLTLLGGIVATAWQARLAQNQRLRAEAEQAKAEAQRAVAEAERTRAEREQQQAVEERARAEIERLKAETERARAERRFNDVRQLANSFLFEFHEAIKHLPGATRARSLLAKRALEYLDSLAREASRDLSLRRELAVSYEKVGEVQGNSQEGYLGDTAAALQSYRKALAIRQALLKTGQPQASDRLALAATLKKIGEILERTRDLLAALENYRQALAIYEALSAARPQEESLRQEMMMLHERISNLLLKVGDQEGALKSIVKAQELFDTLPDHPANVEEDQHVPLNYFLRFGKELRRSGDLAGALTQFRKMLASAEAAVAKKQGNARSLRNLSTGYRMMGSLLAQVGDVPGALEHYQKSAAILADLSAKDPANVSDRSILSVVYRVIAERLRMADDPPGALKYFRQALAVDQDLATQDPANAQVRLYLVNSYSRIGKILEGTGDAAGALANYRQALLLLKEIVTKEPANPKLRLTLSDHYLKIGNLLQRVGDLNGAADHYRQVLSIAGTVQAKDPADKTAHQHLSISFYRLGEMLAKNGDLTGARENYLRTLALREELARQEPTNTAAQIDLAFGYLKLGELFATRAADVAATPGQQVELWRESQSWYQRSQNCFLDLRRRGQLSGKYSSMPDDLSREIAKCEAAVTKLKGQPDSTSR